MDRLKTTEKAVARHLCDLIIESEHENLLEIICDDLPNICIKTNSGQSFIFRIEEL